jgi:Spy/CpxP family protein refolding chaperone
MVISNSLPLTAAPRAQKSIRQFFAQEFLLEQNLIDGRLTLRFKKQITLTAVQIQKIEKLMLRFEEEYIRRWAEIKIKEIQLATSIKSDQIIMKNIERKIREINSEQIEISIKYLNYLLDIKEVLTTEQREKIKSLRKQHKFHKSRRSFE